MTLFRKDQVAGVAFFERLRELNYDIGLKLGDLRSIALKPLYFLKNVWRFRNELWRFRSFDYKFNTDLFKRSLEITADFMESESALSANAQSDAQEIRKFIKYLEIYNDPFKEAERRFGIDYLELWDRVMGPGLENYNFMWRNKPREEWTPEQVKLDEMQKLIHVLEDRSWKNAWKLIGRRGRRWWD